MEKWRTGNATGAKSHSLEGNVVKLQESFPTHPSVIRCHRRSPPNELKWLDPRFHTNGHFRVEVPDGDGTNHRSTAKFWCDNYHSPQNHAVRSLSRCVSAFTTERTSARSRPMMSTTTTTQSDVIGSLLIPTKHLSTSTNRHKVHDERLSQNFDNRLIRQELLQATTAHDLLSQTLPGKKRRHAPTKEEDASSLYPNNSSP